MFIRFIKNLGFYDVYMACLFGLRSIVARNNEQQPRKRPLLYYRSVLCAPLVTFDEIPEYRRINHLNATLHLIINKFIKNQQKTGLNFDFRTNNFTTNQHKTGLNFDCTTNKFTTNQQKTVLNFDFITNLGRFLTNNFITNQQIITNQQTGAQSLERGCHQNKEIVQ